MFHLINNLFTYLPITTILIINVKGFIIVNEEVIVLLCFTLFILACLFNNSITLNVEIENKLEALKRFISLNVSLKSDECSNKKHKLLTLLYLREELRVITSYFKCYIHTLYTYYAVYKIRALASQLLNLSMVSR